MSGYTAVNPMFWMSYITGRMVLATLLDCQILVHEDRVTVSQVIRTFVAVT